MMNSIRKSKIAFTVCIGFLTAMSRGHSIVPNLPQPNAEVESTGHTEHEYKADLRELSQRIKSVHPRPFRFISEPEFDHLVSTTVQSMNTNATYRDFIWAFSKILSSIQCGHSRMPYFNQENAVIENQERFPIDVRFVGKKLYVLDPLENQEIVSKGDEIIAINGFSVADLLANISLHIYADGDASDFRTHAFNSYATAYLTYALRFPTEYQITLAGREQPITLGKLTQFKYKPNTPQSSPCQDRLCYHADASTNAGVMTVRSFAYYGEQGAEFASFVNSAFEDIVKNSRSALIIDIRANHGGSGLAGAYILRRLIESPFDYFASESDERGNPGLFETQQPVDVGLDVPVFLIVDGDTVSSAPHFAALFKEHNAGKIIGMPMGCSKSVNDGSLHFESTECGIEYNIARMRFDVSAPSQPIDDPVQPDIVREYTVNDILNNTDSMMAFAFELAREKLTDRLNSFGTNSRHTLKTTRSASRARSDS